MIVLCIVNVGKKYMFDIGQMLVHAELVEDQGIESESEAFLCPALSTVYICLDHVLPEGTGRDATC